MWNLFWVSIGIGIFFFIVCYVANKDIGEALGGFFGATLISVVLLFMSLLIGAEELHKGIKVVKSTETPVLSLKDGNSGLQGSFFLGSGSIGTSWYYVAFVDTPDGLHKEKYSQEITYIKETDDVSPKVEKYIETKQHNGWVTFLTGIEKRFMTVPLNIFSLFRRIPL